MDIKKQILTALGIDKEIKLEWQAKLTDGTIVVSPAADLEAGAEINILTEDGSQMPLPAGSYETEDGVGFVVEEDGVVAELLTEEEEAPTEEVEAAEEADVADWAGMEKRIQNLEDAVAKLKEDKEGGDNETEEEELSKPKKSRGPKSIKKTEVTEFEELKAENKKLVKELKKLGKEAGADKINFKKFSSNGTANDLTPAEYDKLTQKEKFAYNLYRN